MCSINTNLSLQESSLGIYRPWAELQLLVFAITFHTFLFNLSVTTEMCYMAQEIIFT